MLMTMPEGVYSSKDMLPLIKASTNDNLFNEKIFTDEIVEVLRNFQENIFLDNSMDADQENDFIKELNFIQAAIYHNNMVKGWHNPPRSFGTCLFLIITELAECMEEYRNNKPAIYQLQGDRIVEWGHSDWNQLLKPEGIAVELGDVIIRMFDTAGAFGFDLADKVPLVPIVIGSNFIKDTVFIKNDKEFGEYMMELSKLLMISHEDHKTDGDTFPLLMSYTFCSCFAVARFNNFDLAKALQIKDAYNKTRSHRHGGKVC